ncbi:MAG: hypothetical protein IJ391_03245 [Clostridia bacterium]|nr:hypothetical protein [Clostridia bacterium]
MYKKHECEIIFCDCDFSKKQFEFPYVFMYPIVIGEYEESGAWTAKITLLDYFDKKSRGYIELLFDDAPDNLLIPGSKFVLSPGFQLKTNSIKDLCIKANGVVL